VGVRYWHLGQTLNFNPSPLGLNVSGSQSWADILVGGRILFPLGEKTSIDLVGDVGGWNATAKLDYQFAAILAYKFHRKWSVGAGYRYLFVDYRPTDLSVYNMVTSGAVIGVTYRIK
jgi:opacity protein-like surface antigen